MDHKLFSLQKIGMDSKSLNSEVSVWLHNKFILEMNKSLTNQKQEKRLNDVKKKLGNCICVVLPHKSCFVT